VIGFKMPLGFPTFDIIIAGFSSQDTHIIAQKFQICRVFTISLGQCMVPYWYKENSMRRRNNE
jgi:hypothetical protein